jgi:4-hydroxybenzoate polyprenyltransferase
LIRFQYHLTFAGVVLGVLSVTRSFTIHQTRQLVLAYFSFNVLLYGGIYTMNAITDRDSDAGHPFKKKRPLPSDQIGVKAALLFGSALIAAGFVSGFVFFGPRVFCVYLAFFGVNLFYSLAARGIAYLEIAVNAVTHPLRFMMGVLLAGGTLAWSLTAAIFLLATGMAGLRRSIERDIDGGQGRRTLARYTDRSLFVLRVGGLVAVVLVIATDQTIPRPIGWAVIAGYVVLVLTAEILSPVRRFFAWIWTR